MRILIASNAYPPNFIGGAELMAHEQAKSLRDLGHEVQVFAGETHPFGEHHEIAEDEHDGIPVHRVSMLPHDYDPRYVNFTHPSVECHFRTVAERFRPDVFHGHNLIGLSAALPRIAKRTGAVAVVTLHDHWGFCFKNTLLKTGQQVCKDFTRCAECLPTIVEGTDRGIPIRMRNDFVAVMLSQADALVSPSRYLMQAYLEAGFPPNRFHVIRNGIDIERFGAVRSSKYSGDKLRFSYIGGLYRHKGVKTLVEALGYLPEDSALSVNLVGTGDQAAHCKRILSRNLRTDWVSFWGQVDNRRIEEVYAETDVLVLPSVWPENQPVSITEAAACGIPAIVSDLGGTRELVEDDRTGKVFSAGNARDLARCLRTFLRQPSLATRYGARARERVAPYSFESQVRRLTELYVSLLDAPLSTNRAPTRLVVCHAGRFGRECAGVMQNFPAAEGWRFVLREWLDEELARSAWLEWVVDRSLDADDATTGKCSAAPLLITTANRALLKTAAGRKRGLFWHDVSQAIESIELLRQDQALWQVLAENSETGLPAGEPSSVGSSEG